MKIRFGFILISIFQILLFSCKNDKTIQETPISEKADANQNNAKQADELKKLTIDFFDWYKHNRDRLYKFDYLKGGDHTENDSTAFYIDRKELAKYIKEYEKCGFLSKGYVNAYRKQLNDVANNLDREKYYDGVIEGLDYDYVTQSQDDEEILNNIQSLHQLNFKIKTEHTATAYYEVIPTLFLTVNYIRENKWLIDNYIFEYKP